MAFQLRLHGLNISNAMSNYWKWIKPPNLRFLSHFINFQRQTNAVNRDQFRETGNQRRNFSLIKDVEVMHHSTSFLLPVNQGFSPNYALIILNQPLPSFTPLLWDHAKVRVCADGGANRLYDEIPRFFPQQKPFDVRKSYIPDVIKGDLDSIREDVKDFYAKLGCDAVDESHDQNTTDFHKCAAHLIQLTPESERSNLRILVIGGLGGRFDHEAANLNLLHHFSDIRIILVSENCLIQLLPRSHQHEIHIQTSVVGPHCGLLPMGGPASHTTTSGLKWNLNDDEMMVGGLISTSNMVVSGDFEPVTVRSDADLIWTISIKSSAIMSNDRTILGVENT